MPNYATADLESATVRIRHFSGRPPQEIATEFPILPPDAPGLPPPGPSFRAYAHQIGDQAPPPPPKGKKKKVTAPVGPYLTALVRSALYIDPTGVRLATEDEDRVYYFLPGLAADGFPGRPETCGTYGPSPCRLMVLGKCLGPTEESGRRPYSGPGSRPLWDAWAEAGLPDPSPETPVYLTNLLRFCPPLSVMSRLPKDWVADGVHLLYQELVQVRPEVLWVLGADALKALFGNKAKVDDYRGRVVDLSLDCRPTADAPEDTHVVRVVVSDHPAAVARDPDRHPLLVQSARSVAQLLGHATKAAAIPLDHQPIYTLAELEKAVNESCAASADGGYLAFDCEWEGGHPTDPGSYLYTVQWSHAPGHARIVFLRRCGGALNPSLPLEAAVPLLRQLFCGVASRRGRLVGHFAKADLPWLDSIGVDLYPYYVGPAESPDPAGPTVAERTYYSGAFDTYTAAHATDESATLKLEILGVNTIGTDRWDTGVMAWRDEYCKANKLKKSKLGGYGNMPENLITPYACLRSESLVQLADGSWSQIGHLVKSKYGGKVRSFKDGQVIDAQVTGWHRADVQQKKWCRVVTHTGTVGRWGMTGPVFTPDHKILTQRGKVAVAELVPGVDRVLTDESIFNAGQLSVFLGSLLGDGGFMRKHEARVGFGFGQRTSCRAYLDWKASVFANYAPRLTTWKAGFYRYQIAFNRYFAELAVEYPTHSRDVHRHRKAVVTPKLLGRLGDLGLAVWYQDDGTFVRNDSGSRGTSRIYGKMSDSEVDLVVDWLTSRFGVGISYNRSGRFFQIAGEAFDHFHDTVSPYIHPDMAYKTPRLVTVVPTVSTSDGGLFYERIVDVIDAASNRSGSGVRYCLTVPETGNFLTQLGFVSNCWDADGAGRLYLYYNGDPRQGTTGALDKDRYGNSARQIFGIRMRAWAAWAEMERTGIEVDVANHHHLRDELIRRRTELIAELRRKAHWEESTGADGLTRPAFDPAKPRHRVEFLFGETYLNCPSQRPPGALSLYLDPYKATDTTGGGKLWLAAIDRNRRQDLPPPKPAADKETLIHLARQHELAALLRDIDFLGTATKILFRKPDEVVEEEGEGEDFAAGILAPGQPAEEVHERGLLAEICGDGRVRSTFGFVETGRASSSRPNCQNFSSSIDSQYNRILVWGEEAANRIEKALKLANPLVTKSEIDAAILACPDAQRSFVSRSLLRSRFGWYLVNADLKGAEIAAAAWGSGDPLLIEHAARNTLDESHPDWLDLHSDLAKSAFSLSCTLGEVKKKYKPLRTAAKRARFGHYYGASPDTILRQCLEDDPNVTLEQIVAIVKAHDEKYPVLAAFFAACRQRVHKPGWLRNGQGGLRRFRRASDRDLVASQERESQNWSCQGLVADVMNTALGHLWFELKRRRMQSRIVLSVHDSVMLECPPHEVPVVVDELLPLCITERSPVIPATLDGVPVARGPYHFGIDVEVCRSWGVDVPEAEWREHAKAAA